MKTIVDIKEEGDKLEVLYATNYPSIVDGRIRWDKIILIDCEKGILGKETETGEVVEIKLEKEVLPLTKELKDKLLSTNDWYHITTVSGQDLLFPPNILD